MSDIGEGEGVESRVTLERRRGGVVSDVGEEEGVESQVTLERGRGWSRE